MSQPEPPKPQTPTPSPAPASPKPAAGTAAAPAPSPQATVKAAFTEVYRSAKWGKNAEGSGTSGTGSTLRATQVYRTFLQQFLKDFAIASVVDAGCGDWTFSQTMDWSGIDYKGYDVVEPVIARNKEKFTKPTIQFFAMNFVEQGLPSADLLICKHVLQHLSVADVQKFLRQMPKYQHILLNNSVNAKTLSAPNRDIAPGEFRNLDPTTPPFNVIGTKLLTYWDGHNMQQVVHIKKEDANKRIVPPAPPTA